MHVYLGEVAPAQRAARGHRLVVGDVREAGVTKGVRANSQNARGGRVQLREAHRALMMSHLLLVHCYMLHHLEAHFRG